MNRHKLVIGAVKTIFVFVTCYWLFDLVYLPAKYLSAVPITAKLEDLRESKESSGSGKWGNVVYTAHVRFTYAINGTSFVSNCFSAAGNSSRGVGSYSENFASLWKHQGAEVQAWYLASDHSACLYRNWPSKTVIWLALILFGISLYLAFHSQLDPYFLFNHLKKNAKK
ncbi:MAG: hypothetical protein RL020_399 [Pseudomonadota bacterium]|jgi:hypothetical protein